MVANFWASIWHLALITKECEMEPGPDETLDHLAGEWRVFQHQRGQRFATDDVLVAWTGRRARPRARRLLDLGAGVGSVGLMALMRMPADARLTAVEVQATSAALLRKTVALNDLGARVVVCEGDLRDPSTLVAAERFELILANPPYLPPESASRSPYPLRAGARLELHGDIFDYCRVAECHLDLDDEARFCFCHAASDPRPPRAVEAAGLRLLARQEVLFRAGRPPTIALYTCARTGERVDLPPLAVRDTNGARSAAYREVRREMWIEA